MTTVHLVSHTHWDREWYLPAVRFRQLLVRMVDDLLDDPPTAGASFLLDGQTVVIDDYLAVRPDRAAELAALLISGALEAGPWFVQADELIPSGESLVRNLLAGATTLRALGIKSPPVLYCPDTFGHPASLPVLARGFGCGLIIASRGYGGSRWPAGDSVWWEGADGERVLFHHLSQSGYETGANIPPGAAAARERWPSIRDDLMPRSTLGTVLLMNGADHHARQAQLTKAIDALTMAAAPDAVRASSLTAFANDITAKAADASLPVVRGELRDSYGWMWTLQGTFATRAHQKRRNARIDRLLTRDVEPWVALAARAGSGGGDSWRSLVNAAWRSLLLCHPHDTICGCSTDEVARAMDARLDEAESQARGLRADALLSVIGHDRATARAQRDAWTPMVVVRNCAPRPRQGVALLRLTSFAADIKVGLHPDAPEAPPVPRTTPSISGASAVQILSRSVDCELTESPEHYPDADAVAVTHVAAWLPEVPAYGVRSFKQTRRLRRADIPNPVRADDKTLSNGRISVSVSADGRVEFTDLEHGRTVSELLAWEAVTDLGDLYTPSPRGAAFTTKFEGARALQRGPVRATIETRWSFRAATAKLTARVQLIVDANAPWVRVNVNGVNGATDHRLRLRIATGVRQPAVFADATFGTVERIVPVVSDTDRKMELPLRTAPLHRYVSLFSDDRGGTVFSDGLAEYETDADGGVFITLVRAVGELSRIDLPERPGNAGWPTKTPEAQCQRSFGAELALMLHGTRTPETINAVEIAADDILLPLTGATLRSAISVPETVRGITLEGEGLAFSTAKESEDGRRLVLRCVNLLDAQCTGRWKVAGKIVEAQLARLDETPVSSLKVEGGLIEFVARPREVVTILAR